MTRPVQKGPLAYAALVTVIVVSAVSAGAILFEAAGFVTHGAVASVWRNFLPVAVDAAGLLVAIAFGVQLMSGYRLFRLPATRFRPVHIAIAWGVVALLVLHGTGGVYHSLLPPVESTPILLDWFGLALVGVVSLQLLTGYKVIKLPPRSFRAVHLSIAMLLAAGVVGHTVVAIVHTVTG